MERKKPEVPCAIRCEKLFEVHDSESILSPRNVGEPILTLFFLIENAEDNEAPEEIPIRWLFEERHILCAFPLFFLLAKHLYYYTSLYYI